MASLPIRMPPDADTCVATLLALERGRNRSRTVGLGTNLTCGDFLMAMDMAILLCRAGRSRTARKPGEAAWP